jgi:hypothetical protein
MHASNLHLVEELKTPDSKMMLPMLTLRKMGFHPVWFFWLWKKLLLNVC